MIFNAIVILLAIVLAATDRSNLIVNMGILLANLLMTGGWILVGAAFVVGNIVFLLKVLRERRNRAIAEARSMPVEVSPKDALDPERLRQEFAHFYKQRPALQEQITAAIAQMDSMDRKQAKLKSIFERNHVSSLDEVEVTINDAEQVLCQNMAKLINRIILWDPLEWNKPGKEKIYAEHRAYMLQLLAQGDDILSKCDVLLAETVSYMDEKDAGVDSGRLHLDVMTETIQSLRSIGSVEP